MEERSPEFTAQIDKLVQFLELRQGGYMFAICDYASLRLEVGSIIENLLKEKGVEVGALILETVDADPVDVQIERKCGEENFDALHIHQLPEYLKAYGYSSLTNLNFAREQLKSFGIPILFWTNHKDAGQIANHARDLFIKKARSSVVFNQVPIPEKSISPEEMEKFLESARHNKFNSNIRTALLETQRREAIARGMSEIKIFREIEMQLIENYIYSGKKEEAKILLQQTEAIKDQSIRLKISWLVQKSNLLKYSNQSDALKLAHQALEFVESVDEEPSVEILGLLGELHYLNGDYSSALEYLELAFGKLNWMPFTGTNIIHVEIILSILYHRAIMTAYLFPNQKPVEDLIAIRDLYLINPNNSIYRVRLAIINILLAAHYVALPDQTTTAQEFANEALEILAETKMNYLIPDELSDQLKKIVSL